MWSRVFLCGAKGIRTPDPHTASVNTGVLAGHTRSIKYRIVQVSASPVCAYVQCVFARSRET